MPTAQPATLRHASRPGPVPCPSSGPIPYPSSGPVLISSRLVPVPVPFRPVPSRSVPFRPVPSRSVPFRPVPSRSVPFRPGAHPRGGPGGRAAETSPWNLPGTRFSGFLPLNYVNCIFAACVRKIFAMWEDGRSLQHGRRLALG